MKLKKVEFDVKCANGTTHKVTGYAFTCPVTKRIMVVHKDIANNYRWIVSDYEKGVKIGDRYKSRKNAIYAYIHEYAEEVQHNLDRLMDLKTVNEEAVL